MCDQIDTFNCQGEKWNSEHVIKRHTVHIVRTAAPFSSHFHFVKVGKMADLVLWNPAFFGAKPDLIIKGGYIAWAQMGKSTVEWSPTHNACSLFSIGGVRQRPIIYNVCHQLSANYPTKKNETRKYPFERIFLSVTNVEKNPFKVSLRSNFNLMIGWHMVVNATCTQLY